MTAICMLSNLFPPIVSGSSTQSFDLSRELVARGHKVVVITARVDRTAPEFEEIEGVAVHRLPAMHLPKMGISLNFPWLNATFWPKNLRRAQRIAEEAGAEVLHVHNHMFDMALTGAVLRRRLGLPLAVTIHTVIKHTNAVYNAPLYLLDRFFLKRAVINRADAVICPDANVETYVRERFGRTDTAMVPYGITVPEPPEPAVIWELTQKFDLAGKRVIVSLGHVHALRTRLDLIAAMPAVRERIPEVVLLIVGAVSTQEPGKLVDRLGLGDSVIFAGAQPHDLIPAFLQIADLEAHWLNQDDPSRTSLGVASMEAMTCGKVILAAANPNTFGPGILHDGENLVIVKPQQPQALAATIVDLLGDDNLRQRIALSARETAKQNFGWASITRRTLEAYGVSDSVTRSATGIKAA